MDALQRTKVGLIRRTPADWRQVLTHDPTRPKQWISTLSALVAASFLLVVLFSLAVVLIQPFLLLVHITPYPNLATVSLTTFLVALTLFLLSIPRTTRFYKVRRIIKKGLYYLLLILGLYLTAWFLVLVIQETLGWLKFGEKLVTIYRQFFEILFKFLDWIGLTAIIPG